MPNMKSPMGMTILTAAAFLIAPASQAAVITYKVNLTGAAAETPTGSPGTGSAVIGFDIVNHVLSIDVTFTGLSANTTVAHIHCCTAMPGVGIADVATTTPTFPGFPAGVTSGSYDMKFDTSLESSWNAAFITANGGTTAGAEAALAAGLAAGEAYLNIHTSAFPGGEIRGF
jgi:CHRD domain